MKKFFALAICFAAGCGNNSAPMNDMGPSGCVMIGGQCLFPPTAPAARTQCGDVTEYCDKTGVTTPNLACLTNPVVPPSGPATVTLTGFVHAFSSGPDSKGTSVAIYDAAALKAASSPSGVTPIATLTNLTLDPATQRACDTDGTKGCSIPLAGGCTVPTCADGLNGHADQQKYCYDDGASGVCSDRLRWEARYTIPNVPTNKQLVISSTGANGMSDQVWATVFAWNVFLSTADPDCKDLSSTDCWDKTDAQNPKYQLNVSALSQSDYVNIPQTAGLSGGIPMGQGAVAGEIHDCDNIRIANVTVGVTPPAARFTYFNGDPIKTIPDASRLATDRLGLYAGLSLTPGTASVVAGGLLSAGATLTSFGTFDAHAFPDSVTIVNVNGGKPQN